MSVESPSQFYQRKLQHYKQALSKEKNALTVLALMRLIVFLGTVLLAYLFYGRPAVFYGSLIVGLALFLFLLSRYADRVRTRDTLQALIAINSCELEVLEGRFETLPDGSEYKDPTHFYSQDIDLFGPRSFFQYINRAALPEGKNELAQILLSNGIANVPGKQEAVQELASMTGWRQQFSAIASLVRSELSHTTLLGWFKKYKRFVPKAMDWLPWAFGGTSVLLTGLYIGGVISGYVVFGWFLFGLGITGKFLRRINQLSAHTTQVYNAFRQYQELVVAIEATTFSAPLLKKTQAGVLKEGGQTSLYLKSFAKSLHALDQRNNMLVGVVANGFLLWDLYQCRKIEKWIKKYQADVPQWFATVARFDAYNCLGNFAFNHPQYTFPKVTEGESLFRFRQLGHPLLSPKVRVPSDVYMTQGQFFIVTGANMAGKSTFLRSLSLQLVMANNGLPICAQEGVYTPIKLITSMRTVDSLADDTSYFFAELKRLKVVVDAIAESPYFVVLDEILKGTNSKDKALGSQKFVARLVASGASGIIATHDLSLCTLAEDFPAVENYFFEAEIKEGELYFDYKLKQGICQNMNASFLLRKMGIVED